MHEDLNYEVQNAIVDVQRYLLDQIPPLTALRKVYLFGSLKLIEREPPDVYFDRVLALAMQVCPVEERQVRQVSADAYRVRRLVARWIEEGALQPA